jgi:hypothetical protein
MQHTTNKRSGRWVTRLLAAVVGLATVTVAGQAAAGAGSSDAASILALTNSSRTANGLAPLAVDGEAAGVAQAWAEHLAASQALAHNGVLGASLSSDWTALGENVGVGSDVEQLHAAFMASSAHRANVLGGYDHVGVGTARDGSGQLWVAVVFVALGDGSSDPEPAPAPAAEQEPSAVSASATSAGSAVDTTSSSPDSTTSLPVESAVEQAATPSATPRPPAEPSRVAALLAALAEV